MYKISNLGIVSHYKFTYLYDDIYFFGNSNRNIEHYIANMDINFKVNGTGAFKIYNNGVETVKVTDSTTYIKTANIDFDNGSLYGIATIDGYAGTNLIIRTAATAGLFIGLAAGTGGTQIIINESSVDLYAIPIIHENTFRLTIDKTPSSSSAAGTKGDICSDANYLYRWFATNQVKRIAWSSF